MILRGQWRPSTIPSGKLLILAMPLFTHDRRPLTSLPGARLGAEPVLAQPRLPVLGAPVVVELQRHHLFGRGFDGEDDVERGEVGRCVTVVCVPVGDGFVGGHEGGRVCLVWGGGVDRGKGLRCAPRKRPAGLLNRGEELSVMSCVPFDGHDGGRVGVGLGRVDLGRRRQS
ncbi:hypothetical protein IWX49DRAFT_145376 [Phyllosticta citricarpa]|uniref:Uncharacterized protein n=2 Tax=Phyllosticta TaxID=121621 RepID=A0ABR1M8Y9_9PEZI